MFLSGIKTMPAKVAKTDNVSVVSHASTVEARNALRNAVLSWEDTRKFHPLDIALVRPLVKDQYLDAFDAYVEGDQSQSVMIEIDLNKDHDAAFKFVRAWLRANGKNRSPKDNHYGHLASDFRKNFAPDATHWVLDRNGMVANGGHSGHAVALAFFPPSIEYGIYGTEYLEENEDKDKAPIAADSERGKELVAAYQDDYPDYYYVGSNGNLYETSMLSWKGNDGSVLRVGQYNDDGEYIPHTDQPEIREAQNLTIRLVIGADPKSCLKMDDVRLEADFDDYLEMVGPIREYLTTLPSEVKDYAGTIFRNYYLRLNHRNNSNDGVTYGSLGKGGRLTKNEVQQWFIAGVPMLLDSIELLKDKLGKLRQFTHFKSVKGGKGQISLANALVAMMVSNVAGRERIAKVITETYTKLSDAPEYFQKMVSYIIKQPGDTSSAPNADSIVQLLVFLGEGKKDPVAEMLKQYPNGVPETGKEQTYLSAWQVESNRAEGWDRSNTDYVPEDFTTVCIDAAKRIGKILGDEGAVKNAEMKATRKGVGTRGRNKK